MNKKVARAGLTAVSTAGFLLFGSCSHFKSQQAPRDDIFNNRGGHMPPPTRSGNVTIPSAPSTNVQEGNSLNLDAPPTGIAGGIVIDEKGPAPQPVIDTYKAPEVSTITYTVKRNDSLWKVAHNHGVSVDDLARTNNMPKTSGLKIGQKLSLPPGARYNPTKPIVKSSSSKASGPGAKYTVKKGDSLSVLAWRYKTSISAIKNTNGLKSNNLRIGQKLVIPGGNKPRSGSGSSSSSLPEVSGNVYTVEKGDSLSLIAQKFGTSTKALKSANGLKNNNIIIGKKLVIPASAKSQPGEQTPKQKAVQASVTKKKKKKSTPKPPVESLPSEPKKNPFDEPSGSDDDTPLVDEEPLSKVEEPVETEVDPLKGMKLMDVLVVESDTLDSLSSDFNTTKELILKANANVKTDEDLKPGMVIKVPRAQ